MRMFLSPGGGEWFAQHRVDDERIVPETVVHVTPLSGSKWKWLDSGFSMKDKGKVIVLGVCSFVVGSDVRIPYLW